MATSFSSWGDSDSGVTIRRIGDLACEERWEGGGEPISWLVSISGERVATDEEDAAFFYNYLVAAGLPIDPHHIVAFAARGWSAPPPLPIF